MLSVTFICSTILVTLAVMGLGLNVLFSKTRKFPETSVGHNLEMRKRGITCAKQDEIKQFNLTRKIEADQRSPLPAFSGCTGCNEDCPEEV
ncbi:MAG: hypothetical protein J7L89_04305 [Bacteroidales bacterium]|nr:hypothetical protein [Bacteroidales bacterium]